MTSVDRRTILKRIIESGFQIAPDALEYILGLEYPLETVESLVTEPIQPDRPSVLSIKHIEDILRGSSSVVTEKNVQTQIIDEAIQGGQEESPLITTEEKKESPIRIIKNPDFDSVGSEGTVEDFLAMFNDRFQRIRRIYMSRIDTQTAVSPKDAKLRKADARHRRALGREGMRSQRPPSQKVIGIVKSKSISRSRNVVVELEDSEGSIVCIIPSGRKGLAGTQLIESGNALLLDEIVCISGFVDEDARMIADNVIYPDIPTAREIGRSRRDVYAAFISDIHCGSLEFLEDEFDNFIDWLNAKDVDESDKSLVQKIKYLFIAGDLVDGIGVYPTQKDDLAVSSIYEQYKMIAKKFRKLPKSITIFAIPGNHDASRQALPKPPVPEEFAKPLYDFGERMYMMGDPCHVSVEGVNVLMTHGDSLDDLVTTIPGASYKKPAIPMKELLRKRHLAPLYGGKTELAPLHRDWMVIDTPPDIVHFGHAHHNAVDNYRGVQIINSGTFQGQTDFMRKQGIIPTPGIVTVVNLHTGAPDVRFFYNLDKMGINENQ
ncbi:MAG: DNA-directed DNA polymerase II small subunit [Candidatus Thorarchaeota archaeon]